jgi:anaerobic C4-dicarboxylate transporter
MVAVVVASGAVVVSAGLAWLIHLAIESLRKLTEAMP